MTNITRRVDKCTVSRGVMRHDSYGSKRKIVSRFFPSDLTEDVVSALCLLGLSCQELLAADDVEASPPSPL